MDAPVELVPVAMGPPQRRPAMAYSVSDYANQRRKSRHPNPGALEASTSDRLLAL